MSLINSAIFVHLAKIIIFSTILNLSVLLDNPLSDIRSYAGLGDVSNSGSAIRPGDEMVFLIPASRFPSVLLLGFLSFSLSVDCIVFAMVTQSVALSACDKRSHAVTSR